MAKRVRVHMNVRVKATGRAQTGATNPPVVCAEHRVAGPPALRRRQLPGLWRAVRCSAVRCVAVRCGRRHGLIASYTRSLPGAPPTHPMPPRVCAKLQCSAVNPPTHMHITYTHIHTDLCVAAADVSGQVRGQAQAAGGGGVVGGRAHSQVVLVVRPVCACVGGLHP